MARSMRRATAAVALLALSLAGACVVEAGFAPPVGVAVSGPLRSRWERRARCRGRAGRLDRGVLALERNAVHVDSGPLGESAAGRELAPTALFHPRGHLLLRTGRLVATALRTAFVYTESRP